MEEIRKFISWLGMRGYRNKLLLRLFIKICKHIFISLRYAEPPECFALQNPFEDPDPNQPSYEKRQTKWSDDFHGWDGGIRTPECQDQNLVPYHLATSQ